MNSMNTHGTCITEIDYEIADCNGDVDYFTLEVKIEYSYYPFCPGAYEHKGPQLEPDTPAEVEITSVKDMNGVDLELNEDQQVVVEFMCYQDVIHTSEDALERRAEDRRERNDL